MPIDQFLQQFGLPGINTMMNLYIIIRILPLIQVKLAKIETEIEHIKKDMK